MVFLFFYADGRIIIYTHIKKKNKCTIDIADVRNIRSQEVFKDESGNFCTVGSINTEMLSLIGVGSIDSSIVFT